MSDEEYDRRHAELDATYGKDRREAGIRREQELARLFWRSGWTQERLAERERISQAEASRRIVFGRFLDFIPSSINAEIPTKTLTLGRFQTFWRQTDSIGNERKRFQQVIDLMLAEATMAEVKVDSNELARKIIDEYGDGEWHQFATLVDFLGEDEKVCKAALDKVGKSRSIRAKLETKPFGASIKFRIFRLHDAVSVDELKQKLVPIIKELQDEGRKGVARISGPQVTSLAIRLQRLLDEWSE
jgi:hypothetical protein